MHTLSASSTHHGAHVSTQDPNLHGASDAVQGLSEVLLERYACVVSAKDVGKGSAPARTLQYPARVKLLTSLLL